MRNLTAHFVEKAKPAATRQEIVDAAAPGLRLVVQPSGSKSWAYRYSFGRRHRKLTLGPFPMVTLSDAREKARDAHKRLELGIDPGAPEQRGAIVGDTVAAAMASYKELHVEKKLRRTTRYYVNRELDAAAAVWAGWPLNAVKRRDVIALVDRAAERGPNAGNCCLQVMAAFFSWCESRDLIEASPARGVRRVAKVPVRERVLDDAELKVVWRAADETRGPYGTLAKLLILTGCRRNEIAKLEPGELRADAIELPPDKVKTGEAYAVPLTPLMRSVLATCPKYNRRYVLTGTDAPVSNGNSAKNAISTPALQRWTFHDLRRSFATGLQRLGVQPHIIELALNHKLKGIAGVYQKHRYAAEVKAAFELWSAHIETLTATH
jgi:integrase